MADSGRMTGNPKVIHLAEKHAICRCVPLTSADVSTVKGNLSSLGVAPV
jgi:hypothetical protein